MKIKSLIAVLSVFFCSYLNAEENLDLHFVKSFIVVPFSNTRTLNRGYFELRTCDASKARVCDEVVAAIPFVDLKPNGQWKVNIDASRNLNVVVEGVGSEPVLIAKQILEDGWYRPIEICSSQTTRAQCQYAITRDEQTKSITLRIFKP